MSSSENGEEPITPRSSEYGTCQGAKRDTVSCIQNEVICATFVGQVDATQSYYERNSLDICFDTHTIPVQHGAFAAEELESSTDTASANESPDVKKGLAQVEGKKLKMFDRLRGRFGKKTEKVKSCEDVKSKRGGDRKQCVLGADGDAKQPKQEIGKMNVNYRVWNRINQQFQKDESDMGENKNGLTYKNDALSTKIQRLQKEIQQLQQHEQVQQGNNKMHEHSQKRREEKSEMEYHNQQLRREKRQAQYENQELREENTKSIDKICQLEHAKVQMENKIQQLKDDKSEMENENQQIRRVKHQVESKNQQLREKNTKSIDEIRQLREAKGQMENEIQQLKDEKSEMENGNQQLKDEKSEMENENQQIRREKSQLENENQHLRQETDDIISEMQETRQEKNNMEIEIQQYREGIMSTIFTESGSVVVSNEILGRGAWGTVYRRDFFGTKVAVKEFYEIILSPHNAGILDREIEIASQCRHPNLLQFICATKNDQHHLLIVTEFLDMTLRTLLEERAREKLQLKYQEVKSISFDVARGLNYFHSKTPNPIIHRDVSSANVLLWIENGAVRRAKISDYGSANFMQVCNTPNAGSPLYAAPEASREIQDPKVDVFSYGLLVCEMYVCELPRPEQIERKGQIEKIQNAGIKRLVERCTEIQPQQRPTMQDVIGFWSTKLEYF